MTPHVVTVLTLVCLVVLMAVLALCRELLRLAKPHRPIDFPFAADDSKCRGAVRMQRSRRQKFPSPIRSSVVHRASIDYPFMNVRRRD